MKEGIILKGYLDSKKANKQKFADSLEMSKQNLYQLFESKELQPETKASLEAVTGLKWQEIEKVGKEWVNIYGNVSKRNGSAWNTPDHRDEIISLLKEINNLKDRASLERQLLDFAQTHQNKLELVLHELGLIRAKLEKRKLSDILIERNNKAKQLLQSLKKDGK